MPTAEETKELVDNCDFEEGDLNGVVGNFVIGPNGNSIFIPFAGNRYDMDLHNEGHSGYYWSGTQLNDGLAYCLYCYWDYGYWDVRWDRRLGLSVRPVSD